MLDDSSVEAMVRYNRGQGFTPREIRRIQALVGAAVNGTWDPQTVRAICAWQAKHGIAADGKVRRDVAGNTWPRMQAAFPRHAFRVGIWVDDAASRVLDEAYLDRVASLDIATAALMVNRANTSRDQPDWDLRWKEEQFVAAARGLSARGIHVIFTAWPRPRRAAIDTLCATVGRLLRKCRGAGFEIDAEGNWKASFLTDFANLDEAGQYLGERMRRASPEGTRLELTTYPYHEELAEAPTVAQYMDVVVPQAYSVAGARKPGWGERLGPGSMQETAIELGRRVPGTQLVVGLAAYSQQYPGHLAADAMQLALDTVGDEGIEEVRYWSSKWILGQRANGYAAGFLGSIPKVRGPEWPRPGPGAEQPPAIV